MRPAPAEEVRRHGGVRRRRADDPKADDDAVGALELAAREPLGVQARVPRGLPPGPGAAPAHRSPETAMWGAFTIVESAFEISGGASSAAAFFRAASISVVDGA